MPDTGYKVHGVHKVRFCHACFWAAMLGSAATADPAPPGAGPRHVAPNETWEMRGGRFYQNGQWVFLKSGKLLDPFHEPGAADRIIANIDVMIDRLNYNCVSLNIYPNDYDADGDARIDRSGEAGCAAIARIIDHCWERGVFCALSFETYNVGGGGVPASLFEKHPDVIAVNGLGEPARDVEYAAELGHSKPIPSIFHPAYLTWSRSFLEGFLRGLGPQRASRLLYIETTVEPQYLGQCNAGDRDYRRAALDFSEAAGAAFERWNASLPPDDPRRNALRWPTNQAERDRIIGDLIFNEFRGQALGQWVTGDIDAIRSVVPEVYVAVDYNGRFDDAFGLRVGDHDAFLAAIEGADIIQIAPHALWPWGTASWNDVIRINRRDGKGWAVSEHMTATGSSPQDDGAMTKVLENTLVRGTRWGWDCVKVANTRDRGDSFALYNHDWTSPVLDVIEGENRDKWLAKIGAPRPVLMARAPLD